MLHSNYGIRCISVIQSKLFIGSFFRVARQTLKPPSDSNAGTSHGPLLGRVTDVLDEFSDHLDADKMRFILCRVPVENKLALELRTAQLMECIKETEQKMAEVMEQQKEEVMRKVFADYSEDFGSLYANLCDLKAELAELENEDQSDDDASEEKTGTDGNDGQTDEDINPYDSSSEAPL